MTANPSVYALFSRFALQMADRHHRFGIGLLAERVRWECAITSTNEDDDPYKINNNYRAYIARQLISDHPGLEALMVFRRTRY